MLRRFSAIFSTARILRALDLNRNLIFPYSRRFSCLRRIDNRRSKDDIANWMRDSLYEPIPTQQFSYSVCDKDKTSENQTVYRPFVLMVSEDDYCHYWYHRFNTGDLGVVEDVLRLFREKKMLFTFAQIEILFKRLKYLRRNFEIHEIFFVYQTHLRYLWENELNQDAYCSFLETVLRVEDGLGNYEICEELFSEYIKFPNLNAKIIAIGLKSFIENNNLQLAKEFYIQALKNPDTFPITEEEVMLFLNDLGRYGDYKSVQIFFNLWLKRKCSEGFEYIPSEELLSLVHEMYRKSGDQELWTDFLSHEVIQKTNYLGSILFELNEFFYNLHIRDIWSQTKIKSKIKYFVAELRDQEKREGFYLFLLNFFVLSRDFINIKLILSVIQKDHEVRLKPKFHLAIARYFVNGGMLRDLIGYYSDILKRKESENLHLRISIIDQLCKCALLAYPILFKEITNEFKILLNKEKYIRQFPHLESFLKRLSRTQPRIMKHKSTKFSGLLEFSPVDYERLEVFENRINHGDLIGAKSLIVENLRRGVQPSFGLHYYILQKCMRLQLSSFAKTMDELFMGRNQKRPIKIKILWLRYEILSEYKSLQNGLGTISLSKIRVLSSRLLDFERCHQPVLDFVHYMQLVQISLQIKDYDVAFGLLHRGSILVNGKDKRHWQIYYMTALKLSARVYDMETFLKLLREWNENMRASSITHDCLRQIKSYYKLFDKRSNCISDYDGNTMLEIVKACECLVHKYTNLKFEGLDAMHELMSFLKRWLDIEMQHKKKRFNNRQALLLNKISEEQDTVDNDIK